MEKKMINLSEENTKVVDGKVIIDSEELANAIESEEVVLKGEEQGEGGFICSNVR